MHPTDEEMELYALGRLPAPRVRDFEIHLLVCRRCQDRMAEADATVAAMREACRRYIPEAPGS
jgi:anti-sigma factor RsiW